MLRWRLLLGTLMVAVLVGLCWLDHRAAVPGAWLFPVAVALAVLAGEEMLALAAAGGLKPNRTVVHTGNLLLIGSTWVPLLCCQLRGQMPAGTPLFTWDGPVPLVSWPILALAAATLLAFLAEMHRYERPGKATGNLAAAVLAIVYVGLMLSFVVRLRLAWGVAALVSLLVVVKLGDIGAYTAGRLLGRHRLTRILSPGKTVEGAVGAFALATFGAWLTFTWLVPWLMRTAPVAYLPEAFQTPGPWRGWWIFGPMVGMAGLVGDLAESLLKRDAGVKDSSRWMPGFGGVLDLLDSILLAAPVAYVCWACELVQPPM